MLFTENELASMSLSELTESKSIKKYIEWIKDKPGQYSMKLSNRVKKKKGKK